MHKTMIYFSAIIIMLVLQARQIQAQYLSIGLQGGYSLPVDSYYDGGPNFGFEFENFFNDYVGIGLGFNYTHWSKYNFETTKMPLLTHFKFRIPFTRFSNGGRISMGGVIGAGIAFVESSYIRSTSWNYGYITATEYEDTYSSEEFSMTTGFNFEAKFNRYIGLVYTTRFTIVGEPEYGFFDFLLAFHFYFGKNPVDPYEGFF